MNKNNYSLVCNEINSHLMNIKIPNTKNFMLNKYKNGIERAEWVIQKKIYY